MRHSPTSTSSLLSAARALSVSHCMIPPVRVSQGLRVPRAEKLIAPITTSAANSVYSTGAKGLESFARPDWRRVAEEASSRVGESSSSRQVSHQGGWLEPPFSERKDEGCHLA